MDNKNINRKKLMLRKNIKVKMINLFLEILILNPIQIKNLCFLINTNKI